jgi:hypothetical protein
MKNFGWGTWIRTKTSGVRVRCSTIKLSPTIAHITAKIVFKNYLRKAPLSGLVEICQFAARVKAFFEFRSETVHDKWLVVRPKQIFLIYFDKSPLNFKGLWIDFAPTVWTHLSETTF